MKRTYASKLTKEDLISNGITKVTEDGHVFKGEQEEIPTVSRQGYFMHWIYDEDENGNRIKITKESSAFGYIYKQRSIGLHRLMWAWHYGECPEGMVVDHINDSHTNIEDYHLSNLQLLTPRENVIKGRKARGLTNEREKPCRLDKPRSFYEEKLAQYEALYEEAKTNHDAKAAHSRRASVANLRANLRYYDSHIQEALTIQEEKDNFDLTVTPRRFETENSAIAHKRKVLKAEITRARNFYKELAAAYGSDDPIVRKYWGEWKLAIAEYYGFCKENKKAK